MNSVIDVKDVVRRLREIEVDPSILEAEDIDTGFFDFIDIFNPFNIPEKIELAIQAKKFADTLEFYEIEISEATGLVQRLGSDDSNVVSLLRSESENLKRGVVTDQAREASESAIQLLGAGVLSEKLQDEDWSVGLSAEIGCGILDKEMGFCIGLFLDSMLVRHLPRPFYGMLVSKGISIPFDIHGDVMLTFLHRSTNDINRKYYTFGSAIHIGGGINIQALYFDEDHNQSAGFSVGLGIGAGFFVGAGEIGYEHIV